MFQDVLAGSAEQAIRHAQSVTERQEREKRVQDEVTLSDVGVNISAFKNILANPSDLSAKKLGDLKVEKFPASDVPDSI